MSEKNQLVKLAKLRDEMRGSEKAVVVFRFKYKDIKYFIAVCLLTDDDRAKADAKYALVRLCFMHENDLNDYLDCYANSRTLTAGMTELRKFLGVESQPDGLGWLNGFLADLGKVIPNEIPNMDNACENACIATVCRHEKRDPNKTFRYYIFDNGKENGRQKHRTEYNGQLASFKYPKLYPKFKDNRIVSFAFTDNVNQKEKTEEEILDAYVKKYGYQRVF